MTRNPCASIPNQDAEAQNPKSQKSPQALYITEPKTLTPPPKKKKKKLCCRLGPLRCDTETTTAAAK